LVHDVWMPGVVDEAKLLQRLLPSKALVTRGADKEDQVAASGEGRCNSSSIVPDVRVFLSRPFLLKR
jgi:hypothetical protein